MREYEDPLYGATKGCVSASRSRLVAVVRVRALDVRSRRELTSDGTQRGTFWRRPTPDSDRQQPLQSYWVAATYFVRPEHANGFVGHSWHGQHGEQNDDEQRTKRVGLLAQSPHSCPRASSSDAAGGRAARRVGGLPPAAPPSLLTRRPQRYAGADDSHRAIRRDVDALSGSEPILAHAGRFPMVLAVGDDVRAQQVLVRHYLVLGIVGAARCEGIQKVQLFVHRALRIDEVDNTVGALSGPRVPSASESAPLDLVLDTNVALDWLAFGHPVGATLTDALTSGRCRWIFTRAMRDELADVIARDALNRWAIDAPAVLAVFDALGVDVGTPAPLSAAATIRCSDPDDQIFVDLAIARSAHALLTRDRALLRLASRARRRDVLIATPEAWVASAQR